VGIAPPTHSSGQQHYCIVGFQKISRPVRLSLGNELLKIDSISLKNKNIPLLVTEVS